MFSIQVSPERAKVVIREISAGSRTHLQFYLLLIAASMIACFGLIANSTAVIIGAMLVSPLMTPIFGVALGMLRGNPRLLGRALTTEVIGVILAIGSAYLVGLTWLNPGEATSEMLVRTQPNLIDLFVAVFAGLAGAYALVDERISPALPGVAIATAIVPPLSTCGLCIAMGAWSGAGGALLLFLANFVSILLVALTTFAVAGLRRSRAPTRRVVMQRFGPTIAAFVVVAVILTNSLVHIVRERAIRQGIKQTLTAQLAADHSSDLEEFIHATTKGRVQVLATVRSHRTIPPGRVSAMRVALEDTVGTPVDLVVRTVRSRDVSPIGSSLHFTRPDLDGTFLKKVDKNVEAREALATQVLREQFESEPGFEITRVEYGTSSRDEGLVVAYVNALRRLSLEEISSVEDKLRERFEDGTLRFYIRINSAKLQNRRGPVRVEWINTRNAPEAEIARLPEMENVVRRCITQTLDVMPQFLNFNYDEGRWRILAEVAGPTPVSREGAQLVQAAVDKELGSKAEIWLWYRNDFVVSSAGYTTYHALTESDLGRRGKILQGVFRTQIMSAALATP